MEVQLLLSAGSTPSLQHKTTRLWRRRPFRILLFFSSRSELPLHRAHRRLPGAAGGPAALPRVQRLEVKRKPRDNGGGQTRNVEKLWRDFFADPSQWLDHRPEKVNVRHPDFKHKTTKSALWLDSKYKPSWVDAELAAMAPGMVQESNVVSWNTRLVRHVKTGQSEKTMELF